MYKSLYSLNSFFCGKKPKQNIRLYLSFRGEEGKVGIILFSPPTGRAPRSRGRLSTAVGRTTPVPSSEASALRRGCPWRTCITVTTEIRWYRQTSCACMSQMLPFFTNGKSVATLCGASLSKPFCQLHLLTLCLCHILVLLAIFQTSSLFLCLLWYLWSVIFDVTIAKRLWITEGSEDG